jgi:hypothetical protein
MSTIDVIRQREAVHVITDGGAFAADGTLLFVGPKAWPMPNVNAVLAARGPKLFPPIMADYLGGIAHSYDEFKDRMLDAVTTYYNELRWLWNFCQQGPDFDLVVAGWSESIGPDSYLISSHEKYGTPLWTIVPLGDVSLMPGDPEILERFHAAFPAGTTPDDIDPDRDGVRILEIQRDALVPTGRSGVATCNVRGFAQLCTVRPGSISTRILHRWHDEPAPLPAAGE